ncbi:hypothetical protein A3758_10405 [Oleiphilus sp. HI0118]|nr:hypothetical protein A3758_10405 [Oleiphilus sp. HI0118]
MFTVVRVSGPIFYVNRFGERVELQRGDQIDEHTLLNSPQGNQLIVQSPSGQELSLIVTEPQELGVLAKNSTPELETPAEPAQEAPPSSQATSLRADADSTPQPTPQSDGHHHAGATVERTDLNVALDNSSTGKHTDPLTGSAEFSPTSPGNESFTGSGALAGTNGTISNASLTGQSPTSALSSLIAQQQQAATPGTQANQNLPITITGTFQGAVIEDNAIGATGALTINGGPGYFPAQSYQGKYGDLSVDSQGAWHYTLHNSDGQVQSLEDGQHATEHFAIHARNAVGIDFSHEFVVDVTGTNDIPTINGANVGDVTEESQLTATGQLSISDVDSGEAHFQSETVQGAHGKLFMQENGSWQYELDNQSPTVQALGQNSQLTDTLIIHAADGTPHKIDINISGTNDRAVISGTDVGAVTEESLLQTSGKLDIQDTDTGEAHFQASDLHGQHGILHLQSDGSWSYDLNNQDPSVQALGQGKLATDTITVTTADGTAHNITIVISGTNDAPTLNAISATTATEGDKTLTSGTITATDIDSGDTASFTSPQVDGFTLNKDGSYTFDPTHPAYNGLADGEARKITIPITVTDSAGGQDTQHLVITVTGTNDRAVITGTDTGAVTEDLNPYASVNGNYAYKLEAQGHITAIDPDSGESGFDFSTLVSAPTHPEWAPYTSALGGQLTIDRGSNWHYYIDNRKPEIQSLGDGQTLTDTVQIASKDGTTHTITITIHGTNDAPTVGSAVTLTQGTEDTAYTLHARDLLANASDIDKNDAGQLHVANLSADHGSITDNHDGTYTFTPDADYNGAVQFSYEVQDAHGGSTVASASLDLAAVADAAVITGQDTGSITEDRNVGHDSAQSIQVMGSLSVTDPDAGQDHFIATNPMVRNEKVISDPFQGELHIDRHGNWDYRVANGNSALQALKEGETRDVIYEVRSADGTTHRINITVTGTNDAPIVSGDAKLASGTEDTAVTLTEAQLLANASDVDHGETAKLSVHNLNADHGTITDNRDGTYTFTPEADYNGAVHFTYDVQDPQGATVAASASMSFAAVADAAVISGQDTGAVTEDQNVSSFKTLEVSGRLTITDADAGEARFVEQMNVLGNASLGEFAITATGQWMYTADNAQTAIQELGAKETLTDSLEVTSADGTRHTITVTIEGTNDAPVVANAVTTQTANEDASFTFALPVDTFSDVDATDSLTLSASGTPSWATFDPATGTFTGTPKNSDVGTTQVTVTATDSQGATVSTTFNLVVNNTNDAPTLNPIASVNVDEDGQQATGQLTATDPDSGDHLSYAPASSVDGFKLNTDGSWSFNPKDAAYQSLPDGQTQTLTIPVTVTDSAGATDTQNLTITITGTNDAPTIGAATGAVTDQSAMSASGKISISDVDAGEASFKAASGLAGAHGTLDMRTDGTWTYTLSGTDPVVKALGVNMSLTDHVTVTSADGTTKVVDITINGSNDAPTITSVALSGTEDTAYTFKSADFGFHDADFGAAMHHITITTLPDPAEGALSLDGRAVTAGQDIATADIGKLVFTPAQDVNGDVHFGYTVNDGLADSSSAKATISLAGTPDAAVITDTTPNQQILNEDQHVYSSGSLHTAENLVRVVDPDGAAQNQFTPTGTVHGSGAAATGSWVAGDKGVGQFILHADGRWFYKVDNDNSNINSLGDGDTFKETLTIHSVDGTAHVLEVTVNGSNDAPTIAGVSAQTVTEDTSLTASGQLTITDIDSGEDHFQTQTGAATRYGHFSVDATGQWSYSLENSNQAVQRLGVNEHLEDRISVTSADGTVHVVSVTINGSNDAPVVSSSVTLAAGTEDTAVTLTEAQLLANASDVDHGETVQLSVHNLSADHGTITDNKDGTYTFTPDPDYNGAVSFTYDIQDPQGATVATSASMSLAAVADTPIVNVDIADTADNVLNASESGAAAISGTLDPSVASTLERIDITDGTTTVTVDKANITVAADGTYQTIADLSALKDGTLTVTAHATSHDGTTATSTDTIIKDTVATEQDNNASMNEDQPSIHGNLIVDDETGVQVTGGLGEQQGNYGKFVIHADGSYTYTPDARAQALSLNERQQETFNFNVTDKAGNIATETFQITLTGRNDGPVITGDTSGQVTEDGPKVAVSGVLATQDPDAGESSSLTPLNNQAGQYGHLTLQADGHWVYTLANANSNVQDLRLGQTVHETFVVTAVSSDGTHTTQTLTIDVQGSADAPVLHSFSDSGKQHSGAIEGNVITGADTDQGTSAAATDSDSNAHLVLHDIQIHDTTVGQYVAVTPGNPYTIAGVGTLTIEGNGHYVFDPASGFTGSVPPMTYRVVDTGGSSTVGESAQNVLNIEVTPDMTAPPTITGLSGGGTSMTATLVSPTGSSGNWGVQDPKTGAIEHSEHGQYGSLSVDPNTGVVTYNTGAPDSGVHKTGTGVTGDVIEHFVITQGGVAATQMLVEVHLSAQATHGHSGHYVEHIAVKDMSLAPATNTQNDEPDESVVDDLTIPTITLAFDESAEVNDVDFSRLHDIKQSHTDLTATEAEEKASKVFGSAAENEANDALQNLIADHLNAHQKEKADSKALADPDNKDANAADKDASSDESSNVAHDAAASAHDDSMAGSSSSHMDSLVPKPDDDTLPPI